MTSDSAESADEEYHGHPALEPLSRQLRHAEKVLKEQSRIIGNSIQSEKARVSETSDEDPREDDDDE